MGAFTGTRSPCCVRRLCMPRSPATSSFTDTATSSYNLFPQPVSTVEQNVAPPAPWADLDRPERCSEQYVSGSTPRQQFKSAVILVGVSSPMWRSLLTRTVHRQHSQALYDDGGNAFGHQAMPSQYAKVHRSANKAVT